MVRTKLYAADWGNVKTKDIYSMCMVSWSPGIIPPHSPYDAK